MTYRIYHGALDPKIKGWALKIANKTHFTEIPLTKAQAKALKEIGVEVGQMSNKTL